METMGLNEVQLSKELQQRARRAMIDSSVPQ